MGLCVAVEKRDPEVERKMQLEREREQAERDRRWAEEDELRIRRVRLEQFKRALEIADAQYRVPGCPLTREELLRRELDRLEEIESRRDELLVRSQSEETQRKERQSSILTTMFVLGAIK